MLEDFAAMADIEIATIDSQGRVRDFLQQLRMADDAPRRKSTQSAMAKAGLRKNDVILIVSQLL